MICFFIKSPHLNLFHQYLYFSLTNFILTICFLCWHQNTWSHSCSWNDLSLMKFHHLWKLQKNQVTTKCKESDQMIILIVREKWEKLMKKYTKKERKIANVPRFYLWMADLEMLWSVCVFSKKRYLFFYLGQAQQQNQANCLFFFEGSQVSCFTLCC